MGVVYQAHDPKIDRILALKVLRRDRISGESFVKRFIKEAKVIGRLSHPNIVTVYDIGQDQEDVYIAMEFIEGEPLNEIIQKKKFTVDEIVRFGVQVAELLDYAHEKGVVHRDIKPSNIIFQPNGLIKMTDFGIARLDDSSSTLLTIEGEIMGTPSYMSPEQVLGKKVDGRSDIFSLGVVLYELSSGKRPFGGEGKNIGTIFNEIINTVPREPLPEMGVIPKGLSEVVMKCLNKSPDDRYQSGNELAEALRSCILRYESSITKSPSKRKSRVVPVSAGVVFLLVAGAATYFYLRQGNFLADQKAERFAASTEQTTAEPPTSTSALPIVKENEPILQPTEMGRQAETATADKENSVEIIRKTEEPKKETEGEKRVHAQEIETQIESKSSTQEINPQPALPIAPTVPLGKPRQEPSVSKPVSEKATLRAEKPRQESPISKPVAEKASLRVDSFPGGADIIINGKFEGKTPARVKLSPGTYKITLKMSNYQTWENQIALTEAKEYPVHAELKPVPEADAWVVKPLRDR